MRLEGGDDVLNAVVDGVVHGVVRPAGVAVEALFLILQQEHTGPFKNNQRPKKNTHKRNARTCRWLTMQ